MDSQQQITRTQTAAHAHAHTRLALIELSELSKPGGTECRTVDVLAWPLTVGRALDNHLVIDDPFVAPHHALLDIAADGSLQLSVLDSVNGVGLGVGLGGSGAAVAHLAAGQSRVLSASGAVLQLGNTRLRLRLPDEVLAPERALSSALPGFHVAATQRRHTRSQLWPWLTGLALVAFEAASHWTGLDPGADFSAWLPLLISVPVTVVVWCGVWALLSKLFNHHFDFSGHLKLALPWMLALALTQALWPQLAAALAAPVLWQLTPLIMLTLAACLIRAQLSHVLPSKRQTVAVGVAAMALGAVGVSVANNFRTHDSLSSSPYMSTLPLPALRLGSTGGEQKLVQGLTPLAAQLALRAKKARDGEEDGDDAAD